MNTNCRWLPRLAAFSMLLFPCCIPLLTDLTAREGKTYFWVGSKAGLNMRERPDVKGKVITSIPLLSKLELVEEKDGRETIDGITGNWARITWNGKTGWVFNGYLENSPFLPLTPGNLPTLFKGGCLSQASTCTVCGSMVFESNGAVQWPHGESCDEMFSGKWTINKNEGIIVAETRDRYARWGPKAIFKVKDDFIFYRYNTSTRQWDSVGRMKPLD